MLKESQGRIPGRLDSGAAVVVPWVLGITRAIGLRFRDYETGTPMKALLILDSHGHQLVVGIDRPVAAAHLQGVRDDGHCVRVVDVIQLLPKVADSPVRGRCVARLLECDGNVCGQGCVSL